MELTVSDKYLSLLFANNEEQEKIKHLLTFSDMSNVFLGGSFNKNRIKNICFLKKIKDRYACRSGFLQEVLLYCRNNNIVITKITDERTKFPHQKKEWTYDELRSFYDPKFLYVEHQIQALQSLLKTSVGICKLPTSAGKCCTGDVKINIENIGEVEIKSLFDGIGEEEKFYLNKEIKILTEDGYKKIDCLYKTNKRKVIEIELENGAKIKAVPEHKVKTKKGWKRIIDLNDNDEVEFYEERNENNAD